MRRVLVWASLVIAAVALAWLSLGLGVATDPLIWRLLTLDLGVAEA
jgi:hypothetical protein